MAKAIQFVQDGVRLDYTNGGNAEIKYMDIVPGTGKIFIAAEDIAVGATGSVYAEGVFELPAKAEAMTFGQAVYYSTADGITTTGTNNVAAGYVVAAKAQAATTALVKINA